ncbi:DmsE family decaheme c-type cytochrome [Uliginosibacterium aquaticum]|nr:DmsE family decaheme c-type cytochrome [Uliginosibacterium aquaticum]
MRKLMGICVLLASLVGAADLAAAEPVLPDLGSASALSSRTAEQAARSDAVCTRCHDEDEAVPVLSINQTRHGMKADTRTPTCQACHGESQQHLKSTSGGKRAATDVVFKKGAYALTDEHSRSEQCFSCHKGGANHNNWPTSQHQLSGVACNDCHKVHTPRDKVLTKQTQPEVCFSCHKEQRSQVNKFSHHPIVEGKMSCTSCHNVHDDNPKLLTKSSTNDTCFTCHMEKRGPFVHNHQPVTEDCGICHQPHGTNSASLLKERVPFLCQDCHSHTSHPGQAAGLPTAPSRSTSAMGSVARGCLNCHTNIHGGNSTVNNATAGRFRR